MIFAASIMLSQSSLHGRKKQQAPVQNHNLQTELHVRKCAAVQQRQHLKQALDTRETHHTPHISFFQNVCTVKSSQFAQASLTSLKPHEMFFHHSEASPFATFEKMCNELAFWGFCALLSQTENDSFKVAIPRGAWLKQSCFINEEV